MAGREYLTTITLGAKLASTFKAVIGGSSKALEGLARQSKALESSSKSASAFNALGREVQASREKLDAATFAEKQLATAALGATKPTKEQTAALKAAAAATKQAEKEYQRAQKALSLTGASLRAAGVDTSNLTAEQGRLAAALATTQRRAAALDAVSKARLRLFGEAKKPEPLFDKLGGQVRGIASDAFKLGAAGLGAGLGLFALVKHAADTGDAIDDASKRLHIGAAALQAYHFQGKLAGATTEDIDNGIGKLAVNIGKVLAMRKGGGGGGFGAVEGLTIFGQGGGGDAANDNPFKKIGLDVKQLAAQKPEQQIEAIADAIAKLPTQAQRSAAAVATLGRGGLKLLPILEGGGAALRKFREEGVRTGRFMSDDATQSASDFNDALEELTTTGVNGVVNALGGTLLPVGTKTMKDLTRWVGENQDKIKAWAESTKLWIEGKAIPAIKSAGIWFFDTGGKIVSVVQRVADLVGGFGNLGIAIVAFKGLGLAITVGQITKELVTGAAGLVRYALALDGAAASQRALAAAQGLGGAGVGIAGTAAATGAAGVVVAGALGAVAAHDALLDLDLMKALRAQSAANARSGKVRATTGFKGFYNQYLGGNLTTDGPASSAGPNTATGGGTIKLEHTIKMDGVTGEQAKAGVNAAIPGLIEQVKAAMKQMNAEQRRLALS